MIDFISNATNAPQEIVMLAVGVASMLAPLLLAGWLKAKVLGI